VFLPSGPCAPARSTRVADVQATSGEGSTPLIRVAGVSVGYGQRVVLSGLTFTVARGDFLGVVGPNGIGKTTLLRALLGLLHPRSGEINWSARAAVGYMPHAGLFDFAAPLTAHEVALMGRLPRGVQPGGWRSADHAAARRALERVGAGTLGNTLYRELSAGEQQRVLLARALAGEPALLVLDEPTASMDPGGERAVVTLLKNLHALGHTTIVLVSHRLPLVLQTATTILLLSARGYLFGRAAEVLVPERLTELYGVPVRIVPVEGRDVVVVEGLDG